MLVTLVFLPCPESIRRWADENVLDRAIALLTNIEADFGLSIDFDQL